MADKRPYEESLAVAVHRAEYEYGKANAAPASADRIANINRASLALDKAQQAYDHCLSGQANMIPVER
jgi:hypothetical protein